MSEPTRSAPAGPAHTASAADPAATTGPSEPGLGGLTPPAQDALPAVPGYDLLEEVGRGGMGVVYRAKDTAFGRDVAVKLLQDKFPANGVAARRFADEARITGQLQHPGIPAAYQTGTLPDGRPFLAMKLIKGRTLDDLLRASGGRQPPDSSTHQGADAPRSPDPDLRSPNLVAVFEGVCQAVGYAHAHGVIHRDLKPQNVMVGSFGEVQVMDWGLAKVLASGRREPAVPDNDITAPGTEVQSLRELNEATQAGSLLGTPAYMPPEQAIGAVDEIDARSDVFGLGAVLCVILTGKPPYLGDTAESTRQLSARAKLDDALARLAWSDADPGLVALCRRCLSPDKADRPADAGAVAAEVAALRAAADERARQAELDRVRADGDRQAAEVRAAEQARRRRAVQWAAGAVAGVLLLGVAGTTVGLFRADRARQAEADQRKAAEAAKGEAEAREREANAVVKYFDGAVFAAARPKGKWGGLSKDITMREAITASLPALVAEFRDQPLVEARLRMSVGGTFRSLGDLRAALEQYERARALYAQHLGPEGLHALWATANIAAVLLDMGRTDAAVALIRGGTPRPTLDARAGSPAHLLVDERLGRGLPAVRPPRRSRPAL